MTSTTQQLCKTGRTLGLRDQGAGDPVVLVHGVGMQSAAWGPQIEELSQTHRVIAVDMPGHGASAPLPDCSQLPDYVAWLHDVVQTLSIGRSSFVGHSMGALIVGGFAVDYPHLAARVALLNGVYRRDGVARASVAARAADIRAGHLDFETPLQRWFGRTETDQVARVQVGRWLKSVKQDGYATAYAAFAHGDATYAGRYSEIRCPFLAMTGGNDPNSTAAMSRAMAETVQDGTSVTIKGHRHMVNLTAPQQVTAQLKAWLDRTAVPQEVQ